VFVCVVLGACADVGVLMVVRARLCVCARTHARTALLDCLSTCC